MIQTLYSLKCDECKSCCSIVSTRIKTLLEKEVENGPWVIQYDDKGAPSRHLCPACAVGWRPTATKERLAEERKTKKQTTPE